MKDLEILIKQNLKPFREAFNGPIIAAGGYLRDTAEAELNQGTADLITFGEWNEDAEACTKQCCFLEDSGPLRSRDLSLWPTEGMWTQFHVETIPTFR